MPKQYGYFGDGKTVGISSLLSFFNWSRRSCTIFYLSRKSGTIEVATTKHNALRFPLPFLWVTEDPDVRCRSFKQLHVAKNNVTKG